MNDNHGNPFIIPSAGDSVREVPVAVFDAALHFGAEKNGTTDASPAIQAALNAAAELGGGTVWLPPGVYRCENTLIIPKTVGLLGEWHSPNITKPASSGTVLLACPQRREKKPFILLEPCSGINGLTILYPDQNPKTPFPYPAAVKTANGSNFTLERITILGAFRGIEIGPEHNELYYLRDVYISALHLGFYSDGNSDIGRLEGVRFDPRFWTENSLYPLTEEEKQCALRIFREKAVAIRFERNDWGYQYDIGVYGHQTGILLAHSTHRDGNHMAFNGVFMNVLLEDCETGILIEQTKICGAQFTDLTIKTSVPARSGIESVSVYHGVSQFLNFQIEGDFRYPVLVQSSSKEKMPGNIKLASGVIEGYDAFRNWAVTLRSGSLVMQDCEIKGEKKHLFAAEYIYSLSALGCRFGGEPDLCFSQAASDNIQISHDPVPVRQALTKAHRYPESIPFPKAILYDAADFGASPEARDNTAALQAGLNQAGKTGGILYVSPGQYKIYGHLRVPRGVELRGSWGFQYITEAGGTELLPFADYGTEECEPFIILETGGGLRGLTIFYPEQGKKGIVPYPWAVQGRGENVWAVNVSIGNAYNGVDFGTYPCDGHYVNFVVGSPLRRGVFAGNSKTGWLENIHFNPNYGRGLNGVSSCYIVFQLQNCEAIIVGDCNDERLLNTFVYGSKYGLSFIDQGAGGANAAVLQHATDGSENGLIIRQAKSVEIINAQLVAMSSAYIDGKFSEVVSDNPKRNFVTGPGFTGKVYILNSVGYGPVETQVQFAIYGGEVYAGLHGCISGNGTCYVELYGGELHMLGATFDRKERFVRIPAGEGGKAVFYGCYCRPSNTVMTAETKNTGVEIIHPFWA